MKKVLVMMLFALLAVSRCFAGDGWADEGYNFRNKHKICVVYSLDPIYEDGNVDFYTKDKLEEYVYEDVKGKYAKKGYLVEIGGDKVRDSDIQVQIYFRDYRETKRHIQGYSYKRPVTREKVIEQTRKSPHSGKDDLFCTPGTYRPANPHGNKNVTKITVTEYENVYVPGYDVVETHVAVNYEVFDTRTNKKVFVLHDQESCDGSDVAKAFKKSLKNFWKAFEKKALK